MLVLRFINIWLFHVMFILNVGFIERKSFVYLRGSDHGLCSHYTLSVYVCAFTVKWRPVRSPSRRRSFWTSLGEPSTPVERRWSSRTACPLWKVTLKPSQLSAMFLLKVPEPLEGLHSLQLFLKERSLRSPWTAGTTTFTLCMTDTGFRAEITAVACL